MISATSRAMAHYRESGCLVGKTEHWNEHARLRQDLFGFVDFVALPASGPAVAVQSTTATNLSARRNKILTDPKVSMAARQWLATGARIQIAAVAKVGPRGKRKVWVVAVHEVRLEDFPTHKPSVSQFAHLGSC